MERKKFDNDIFNDLGSAIEVMDADVKVAFRLGNPKKETNRPLKVVLNNKKHRKDVIVNASKLKSLPQTSRLSKCIIAKDLTIRQREQNKQRREEKRQSGQNKLTREYHTYNDETVYQTSTNKKTTTSTNVENIQDNMAFSFENNPLQPLLSNI